MLGGRSLGTVGNHLGGRAVISAVDRAFTQAVHRLRTRHGMTLRGPSASRRAHERANWPVLHGFSEQVVSRPKDWRPGLEIAGYWWPHDTRALPGELEEFLAAGPPPVFVGLGSATVPDPEDVSAEIVRAPRTAGLRGVIQQGWGGLAARGDDDDVITVGDVPHAVLFPRTAAVVHHAGAGTTAAVLRAGVPTIPVPVQFDGFFWAARLVALGTAPEAVPLRRLTAAPSPPPCAAPRATLTTATAPGRWRATWPGRTAWPRSRRRWTVSLRDRSALPRRHSGTEAPVQPDRDGGRGEHRGVRPDGEADEQGQGEVRE